jgi:four helix bundle protein
MAEHYKDFRDLLAYKKAFEQACQLFEQTLNYPKEEKFSLIDQIRRSSRSVCVNLAEAYRKRDYIKHFLLKITDCMGENSETLVWLEFSLNCKYITEAVYEQYIELNEEITKLLKFMYNNPDKFGVQQ